jgi:type I restriction enzyme, S subunit
VDNSASLQPARSRFISRGKSVQTSGATSTSVAAVYQKDLLPLAVALPPMDEQLRIVAEVDCYLSVIREVEAEVDANLQRAQALRQSVLSKQFL